VRVLGISAFYHDSAAACVEDGRIVAAAQEERFTRKKHDPRFPTHAIEYCLEAAGVGLDQFDYVSFYDKPFLKFERLLETYVAFAPRGFQSFSAAIPVWLREKLFQRNLLKQQLKTHSPDFDWDRRLLFAEHHQSHAASAFYPSPFSEAVVLTMDGVGEWATTSAAVGRGGELLTVKEIHFPHSLGLLYSAFTYYTGFKVNSGEYKLMGLAPYGKPVYHDRILDHLIDLKKDGSFRLNLDYFDYCTGLRMTNKRFDALFGGPPRAPGEPLTQRHMDLAASIQTVLEEAVLRLTRALAEETGLPNLCLAGGVALNCVANGKILRDGAFDKVWVQPAAGDAGGALGAALAAYHGFAGGERKVSDGMDAMHGTFLGPEFEQGDIEKRLSQVGSRYAVLDDTEVIRQSVDSLEKGEALGWFQGRMEFGPRALGGRSILGDPRSPSMQRTLNLKVKNRESFRPFAPAVLFEDVDRWFDLDRASPYMLFVSEIAEKHRKASAGKDDAFGLEKLNVVRSDIPAVTHVDFSARVQTVHGDINPRFHALLSAFKQRTGCPVLVNTSFNVRGEPIVGTPEDAMRCFMGTELDTLVIGNCLLRKGEQDSALRVEYASDLEPD
jgi:carbamoyltransferase